jgi:tetratricopeptide (TPR) repeat protein
MMIMPTKVRAGSITGWQRFRAAGRQASNFHGGTSMFSKFTKKAAMLVALMALLAVAASAQTTQVEGTVKVKAADGTLKPVAGAQIDIYRTDVKGQWNVKSDKTGRFIRLGIPVQGTFLIVVSAPECEATWLNNIRISQVPSLDVVLNPGDGAVPTYDQVMANMKGGGGGATSAPRPSTGDKAKMDEAAKEREAKVKEAQALQASLDESIKHFKQGAELKTANNYAAALSEFEQAAAIDPGKHKAFVEVAYKANAQVAETHYQLGAEQFNQKQREAAKTHFEKAYEASKKAIALASTATDDPNINNELIIYNNILVKNALLLAEHFGMVTVVDETVAALDKLETLDAVNKAKYEVKKGDLYRVAGNSEPSMTDKAVATYKNVLTADPSNIEALYFLGIALLGSPEKEKIQESLNYLSDFVAKAPPTDKRVPDAKSTIAAIKEQYKIEAEKPAKRGGRKP